MASEAKIETNAIENLLRISLKYQETDKKKCYSWDKWKKIKKIQQEKKGKEKVVCILEKKKKSKTITYLSGHCEWILKVCKLLSISHSTK